MSAATWTAIVAATIVGLACSDGSVGIVGEWDLVSYGTQTEQEPALADRGATVVFEAGGDVHGHTGCNTFGGRYEADGMRLVFEDVYQTLIGCGDAVRQQEAAMMGALQTESMVEFDGDTATLLAEGSDAVIVLSRR